MSQRQAMAALFVFGLLMIASGPTILPRLLGSVWSDAVEGVPCRWLRHAPDLRVRQSALARAASEPLRLELKADPWPASAEQPWTVKITVINRTAGTVPFLYHPDQVLIGNDLTTSGVGLIFQPAVPLQNYASRQPRATHPLADIRLLGPYQRCSIALEFPGAAALIDRETAQILSLQAYYRVLAAGEHAEDGNSARAIFPDQGLSAGSTAPAVIHSQIIPPGMAGGG